MIISVLTEYPNQLSFIDYDHAMIKDNLLFECRVLADLLGLKRAVRTNFFVFMFPGRIFKYNECQKVPPRKRISKRIDIQPSEAAWLKSFIHGGFKGKVPGRIESLQGQIKGKVLCYVVELN